MTFRFVAYRIGFYVAVFLLSGTVLGLAAHFATLFPSGAHHNFTIFALVVSSLNILLFLLSVQWALPRTEVIELSILAALWLAMGAWSGDIIGFIQCDGLGGQSIATKSGFTSYQGYCYEMKVIQAFSWMTFVLIAFAIIVLMQLATQAQMYGRYNIWLEPIRELPWFGEAPGYYNTYTNQYPQTQMVYPYPTMIPGMQPVTPGHTMFIQPGINGQATITQLA
ncbi:hypothetical protein AX14_010412 [Amanita brunnescens Koide BX004]|nr:hypothetical protein AX14_010412 [Amanita brunnescens Koide BX004]